MTYVVSFDEFEPEPRYDNTPWTHVIVEEAASKTGPFTQIDDIALNPFDLDPANPMMRSFSTHQAVLPEGWYRITFKDATGNSQLPVAPVHRAIADTLNYTPTTSQVARKILSRTRDQYGNETGAFTGTSQPTAEQVHELAIDAAGKVSLEIGDDIPDALLAEAADLAAIRTAMDVELTYFSDQVSTGRSIYPQLKEQYDALVKTLQRAVTLAEDGDGSVIDAGPTGRAQYSFPTNDNRWMTRRW